MLRPEVANKTVNKDGGRESNTANYISMFMLLNENVFRQADGTHLTVI